MSSPAVSPTLLTALRHEKEHIALVSALLILILLLGLLGIASWGMAILFFPFLIWLTAISLRLRHRVYLGNAIRVSSQQLPAIARESHKVASLLPAPPFEVLVVENRQANAYAFGWWSPQVVVLSSGLVEMLTPDELRFIIGHEVGHILLGHTRITSLVGGLIGVPNIPVISSLGSWVFLHWSRLAEYSADRVGLLAAGSLEVAESALLKLLVGPRLAAQLNLKQIWQQHAELKSHWEGEIAETALTHPYLVHRLAALRAFWQRHGEAIQRLHSSAFMSKPIPFEASLPMKNGRLLDRWRPALSAAARWSGVYLILAAFTLFTGWASLWLTLFLQVALGFVAAWQAARQARFHGAKARAGLVQALAAAWILVGSITSLILVLAMVAGIGSAGVLVPLMLPYLAALPSIGLLTTLAAFIATGLVWIFPLRSQTAQGGPS